MYPAKGNNLYGQQTYPAQQAYGQSEDIGGYRGYSTQGSQYGGQYASVYGSANLTNLQQGRAGYVPPQPESAKFSSASLGPTLGTAGNDYASTGFKGDQYSLVKGTDYASVDRRYYGEHHSGYLGRDLTSDQARRYGNSGPVSHQSQSDVADRVDQAAVLRQQQMLKVPSLQPDPDVRHTDYLAARAAGVRHGPEDLSTYGGRVDADPRPLPVIAASSYSGQHSSSILGGAPRRNVDDLLYLQGSSSSSLGVGLPPGRDYSAGKAIHGSSLDHEYQLNVASRGGHPSIAGSMLEDGRGAYQRELEIREEERRRELLLLEKEREREREHERERERERERDRDRERERERERARDRERERESERERERERERKRQIDRARDRERLRLLERREKEKERESKHGLEPRRERSPARKSRERRGSSAGKDGRLSRRISPHRDTSHRHHSPVKEKRREYVCKVNSYCLVEKERDYLSISKRYPRLSISPYFSKLVVHWPKGNLNISLHTPVSFEHSIVDRTHEYDQMDIELSKEPPKSDDSSTTIWNAKVILMSGVSQDALEEMCSSRSSGDRIQHLNNILKFAVLRKGHSFLAIGGRWIADIDGGDPSVDDSALLRTVTRCVKDIINLDLQNCQHWNRFLEIHYDRVGTNGLLSHKEVTVLFLPDLRECLPSLDLWRSQWLERRTKVQRQTKASPRKEKDLGDVDDKPGDDSASKSEKVPEGIYGDGRSAEEKNDPENSTSVANRVPESQSEQANSSSGDGQSANKNGDEGMEKPEVAKVSDETDGNKKSGKKVIRRVIPKSAVKKDSIITDVKPDEVTAVNVEAQKQDASETTVQQVSPSQDATTTKAFTRKKVVRKVVTRAAAANKDGSVAASSEDKSSKDASLQAETEDNKLEGIPDKEVEVKTTGKKKIIRRVIKRKVKQNVKSTDEQVPDAVQQGSNVPEATLVPSENVDNCITATDKPSAVAAGCQVEASETQGEKQTTEHKEVDISIGNEKQPADNVKTNVGNSPITPDIDLPQKKSKKAGHDTKVDSTKVGKDKKEGNSKHDSNVKTNKEVTKTITLEDAPQHPGLFLETKRVKDTKMRSMSISLEGLLDYNAKDIEESTFELSLFAESLSEMVQFEMGCCLLSFLEKLHRKVVVRRSQKKRERKEKATEVDAKSRKQLKIAEGQAKESVKSKSHDSTTANDEREAANNDGSASKAAEPIPSKVDEPTPCKAEEPESENKAVNDEPDDEMIDEYDDPEEVDDDGDGSDAEMDNASTHSVEVQEPVEPKVETVTETERKENAAEKEHVDGVNFDAKVKEETTSEMYTEEKSTEVKDGQEGQTQPNKVDDSGKVDAVVNKELLRAFRYFDRNRVGYIKAEDLRFILHSLGKFLSHRDVKEIVHSALLETNSSRDNRVLYDKLVKLSDV